MLLSLNDLSLLFIIYLWQEFKFNLQNIEQNQIYVVGFLYTTDGKSTPPYLPSLV